MAARQVRLSDIVGKGYADFWQASQRYRVVKGSRASKKSTTAAMWYIVNMMAKPAANLLVVRRYGRTLKDSCFAQLRWAIDRLGVSQFWRATTNPMELTYEPTGQKILFRGLDDGLKITSITVAKGVLCWVWIDEAYEVRKDDFEKLDGSIRGTMPKGLTPQITLTFNPWSDRSWLKSEFFDKPRANVFTKTTTYRCNEWLSPADLERFAEMQKDNPRRFAIEGDGNWGVSEGLIFDRVSVQDFDAQAMLRNRSVQPLWGLDFGFTDPTVLLGLLVDEEHRKVYVWKEWTATGCTNAEIAEAAHDLGIMHEKVICDSAEPKSIAEMRKCGINAVPAYKGPDSVQGGIRTMQGYEWVIHPSCTFAAHDFMNYVWKRDKSGQPTDTPEHEFSHAPDAARYAMSGRRSGMRIDPSNIRMLRTGV